MSSEPVVSTVLLELVGLGVAGLGALVGWPFGWLPDPALVATIVGMAAFGPAVERYRAARPPRGRAVAAAFLTLAAVALAVAGAVNWALPPAADQGIGLVVGYLVAMPAAVAVLARRLGTVDGG
ncbi:MULTISPECIES: hypothetical protein [unclassified Streptomyces]|uniref:hypothetical protein n=1 Tax=unclassified Streptomyces TaxID=2593676 RepID=UPI002E778BF5|nr:MULTISPECIES: hypothetical protein [unclassified Streptomyces]MEE1766256.1 hypothetical protein [Streptomyces sp. SP18BB07]MEE1836649.1 hypothetical protein [Streptomyces sp. SP17KL33]